MFNLYYRLSCALKKQISSSACIYNSFKNIYFLHWLVQCYRANKYRCNPIFQSATSAAWTDGLMRGTHVLSYFLQSALSDILTGGNYGQKNPAGCKIAWTHTQKCVYSEGQNCIRGESWSSWLAYSLELSLTLHKITFTHQAINKTES